MNGEDILNGMGAVHERFVHEAENTSADKNRRILKYAIPLAASLTVILLIFGLYQQKENSVNEINHAQPYALQFGDVEMMSANKVAVEGYFRKEIHAEQASKILPIIAQKYKMKSIAHYSSADDQADLYQFSTTVTVNDKMNGNIIISSNEIINDCVIVGENKVSQIEGIPIEAGVFITDKNSKGEQNYIYYANFKMDGIYYSMEFVFENESADDIFSSIVADVILGGKAELSIFNNPIIPKLIDKKLTEMEAYNEIDFGKYLMEIPEGYLFNSANRLLNQGGDSLFTSWSSDNKDATTIVSALNESNQARIVSPEDTTLYDMSLYTIPWADSMPNNAYHIIENPVFRIEELTLDIIKARGYTRNEVGDSSDGLHMRFSVLYNDVVVDVSTEGLSAEYLYDQLLFLPTK